MAEFKEGQIRKQVNLSDDPYIEGILNKDTVMTIYNIDSYLIKKYKCTKTFDSIY